MWRELVGTWGYHAGVSGTLAMNAGDTVLQIIAHGGAGGGTVKIFGGDDIVIPANDVVSIAFRHTLVDAKTGALNIVFTTTTSYFVEYVKAGNT